MRVVVDLTRCQGYGQCVFLAPDVFTMHGQEALMYDTDPDDAQREHVLRAAAACPVQALHVDRMATQHRTVEPELRHPTSDVDGEFKRNGHVVIVGASLAGGRAAGVLRRDGFKGKVTLIGDEKHQPYDRPPLSKQVLTGRVDAEHTMLPHLREIEVEWLAGTPATGLDIGAKQVTLADGRQIGFDKVLIATGARARPWPNEAEAALDGVYVLRTLDEADRMRRRLAAGVNRVLIIGAGFTGSEVASVCRGLDLEVTVVEAGPAPLVGALGRVIGDIAAGMQRDAGVDLRCGVTVTELVGDEQGRLTGARLSDGGTVEADMAVVALGAVRNVEWLEGSGLAAGPWGWPPTRAAAPSTSTAWSPMTSSSPVTWPGSRTRSTTTSSCRWSTGATPSPRRRSPPTTCSATRLIAGRTCRCRSSGPTSSASTSSRSA
ncbi:FAD-dependent oxidoreductase [Nonomuraea recticatena]|uniref:FAD-dependent oxidoreductase n=1 Tax=Nonomuraea recticatena TaxID=46178 RepID=UPI00361D8F6B